jgi:integrase
MPRTNVPSYRLHKPSGQAIVSLSDKIFYLVKYKSKASREKYNDLIAEYITNNRKLPPTRSLSDFPIEKLAFDYLDFSEKYYSNHGKPTDTFGHCKLAIEPIVRHYGGESISDFGPLSLVFIRDKWVEAGIARKTINRWTGIIKQMFQWGVTYELVDANIYHALQAVSNLKLGRTTAPEYEEVPPVDLEIVEKTIPFMPPVIVDMVWVQLYAGMRPQDVRNMRVCDIDRSGNIWKYTPFTHKTKHRGKTRNLAIGPKAQAVLIPYLEAKSDTPEAFLFSPVDTLKLINQEKRRTRKTKVQPSQICRKKSAPKRKPCEQYSRSSYNRAIQRACEKAGIEPWSPTQLRHTAGTKVRDEFGLEYAQAVLGHASAKTTEIYAQVSFEKAAEVMRKIG